MKDFFCTYDIINFGCYDERFAALMTYSRFWLAVPVFEFIARVQVEEAFQTADVILNDGEVLVLHRTANLTNERLSKAL